MTNLTTKQKTKRKLVTIYNTVGAGENLERYLEGTTCKEIQVFPNSVNVILRDGKVIVFTGFPYKLEEV